MYIFLMDKSILNIIVFVDLNYFFMRLFLTVTVGLVSDVIDAELLPYNTISL